jgi:sec-independent protein translocase protein TatA
MPIPQAPELIVIAIIVVLLFGASRIGELGGALGKTVREFRKEMKGDEDKPVAKAEETKPAETKPEEKKS